MHAIVFPSFVQCQIQVTTALTTLARRVRINAVNLVPKLLGFSIVIRYGFTFLRTRCKLCFKLLYSWTISNREPVFYVLPQLSESGTTDETLGDIDGGELAFLITSDDGTLSDVGGFLGDLFRFDFQMKKLSICFLLSFVSICFDLSFAFQFAFQMMMKKQSSFHLPPPPPANTAVFQLKSLRTPPFLFSPFARVHVKVKGIIDISFAVLSFSLDAES
ncbi:uncharacterized protein G2W53_029442 [Senna tora]|uniref:Uncharacterized protein n=1 Tax=Senna tora TaxID=362788 RepID=A0A834T5I9_9FABA|nr:uncharacterized protein G2W53_029442 [Senna tora]